ncbi:MAG: hypothetical protein SFX19_00200 [Alphaproteobacteria bacterium]|nr:hypothetical protein [Alphaproteobacteria bacterium]
MEKPAEKPEVSTDEQLNKAQKRLKQAHDAQPMNAAKGALVGGVTAETVALGAMYVQFIMEIKKTANRMGMSFLEIQNRHIGQDIVSETFTNPQSIKALAPAAYMMIAAPFVGSALGSWLSTRWGNQKIDKEHAKLDTLQETKWQEKIAAESAEKTTEAPTR